MLNRSADQAAPLISGSFTDWKYKEMMTLDSFLKVTDKTEMSEIIEKLKVKGQCRWAVESQNQLNKEEMIHFKTLVNRHHMVRRL